MQLFSSAVPWSLTFTTLQAHSAYDKIFFSDFSQKIGLDISCKMSSMETLCMECKVLFFGGKNKKNISKCPLLKILPRVLSVNMSDNLLLSWQCRQVGTYCPQPDVLVWLCKHCRQMLSVQEYEYRRLWHSNVTLGNTVDWLSKDSTTHLMGRAMQKRVFKYMRTENAQTSLRICAV